MKNTNYKAIAYICYGLENDYIDGKVSKETILKTISPYISENRNTEAGQITLISCCMLTFKDPDHSKYNGFDKQINAAKEVMAEQENEDEINVTVEFTQRITDVISDLTGEEEYQLSILELSMIWDLLKEIGVEKLIENQTKQ